MSTKRETTKRKRCGVRGCKLPVDPAIGKGRWCGWHALPCSDGGCGAGVGRPCKPGCAEDEGRRAEEARCEK